MINAVTRKLHRLKMMSSDDAAALSRLAHAARPHFPHKDIVKVGEKPDFALAILSGWAIRYTVVKNGSRQIIGFLLPGDFCHLNLLSDAPMDHTIVALSPITVVQIKLDSLTHLFAAHPNIAQAVQAAHFADESQLRASITNLGRRGAAQRLGYLLCDLWSRAAAVGLVEGGCLEFPATQADVADAIGLTAVHVNRMMRCLREDGLIDLKGRYLGLPDFNRLAHISGYRLTTIKNDRDYRDPKLQEHASPSRQPSMDSHNRL
ncbi:Crp/Fnr family transcriptional regulator [Sphingomonas sp. PAMC 26617]|uniref:Crp/Fnr family transcriptional regulator n=1 Tax=Sphingomonas sp. PAMC 26617 TaxID=1112216 RepID=UPI0018DEDA3E|nr:Crp/Fnr family transcriptional regulator [Sphingomonas sp. PAMC 26617]